jgi:hypothetical protein
MSKPNPEEFARALLWQVCGLRAELMTVSQDLIAIKRHLGIGQDLGKIFQKLDEETELQREIYTRACKKAGLVKDEPPSSGGFVRG